MFAIPEEYGKSKRIALKDFIPQNLNAATKKRIRDCLKKATLLYQIEGERIPSVLNDTYNYRIIQFYDMEIVDLKKASFLAKTYQEIIKPPSVLRLHDGGREVYSFALKRLNKNDLTEIVVTDSFMTDPFQTVLPDRERELFIDTVSYGNIENISDKVSFYLEMYLKAYILTYQKAHSKAMDFLSSPLWYSQDRVKELHLLLKASVESREKLKKAVTAQEKMELNRRIKEAITGLDKLINL